MNAPASTMTPRRQWLTGFPGFAAATLALIGLAGAGLTFAFRGPGDGGAIALSALVAIVVQLAAFPAVRHLATRNMMLGWGAGSLVRLMSLVVYALAASLLKLPLTAALISLFVFYFLSMVIEPLFLRP